MLTKILLCTFLLLNLTHAASTKESSLYKEKQELIAVKDELNEFYEIKELEYQKNKSELEKLQKDIKDFINFTISYHFIKNVYHNT